MYTGSKNKMQIHNAIVVRATDYKESDRLLRLFTYDAGIITAVIKGVKNPKAKLKFAGGLFSFCEYSLTEKGGFYSVVGASPIESLFAITQNPDMFKLACVMLEVSDVVVGSASAPSLFIELLKAFKGMLYDRQKPYFVAADYITKCLEFGGYSGRPMTFAPTAGTLEIAGPTDNKAALYKACYAIEKHFDVKLKAFTVL